MRFFQYSGSDNQGKPVQGTLQAATPEAAATALRDHGLAIRELREILSGSQPAPQPPKPQTPSARPAQQVPRAVTPLQAPRQAQQPVSRPLPNVVINTPSPNVKPIVHTPIGSDKDRFFLFAQLASAAKAGLNPAQVFQDIAHRSKPHFTASLMDAAAAASEGIPVSTVFARYPDLYPEHVVGTTAAGEAAGFLPEAFDEISLQAESAHKFKRWFFWIWFLAINFLLSIPGTWIATRALLTMWDQMDKTGGAGKNGETMGMAEALGQYMHELWKAFLWPWGPITIIAWIAIAIFRRYFGSRFAKRMRHQLGLRYPVFGPRAKHESLSRFSWTMSRVAKAGIAPARAWQLAADSVPNLIMRDRLSAVGSQLQGTERLSELVHRSGVFPEEYAPMVATAEYTGDMAGAMQRLSDVSQNEFQVAQNGVKLRAGCWGALGCFVTSGLMLAILLWTLYHELPAKILSGMD